MFPHTILISSYLDIFKFLNVSAAIVGDIFFLKFISNAYCQFVTNFNLILGHLFRTTKFSGTVEVRFIAHFQGGKGDNAWQHAQLFRQKLEDIKASEFDFIISFRKKCD